MNECGNPSHPWWIITIGSCVCRTEISLRAKTVLSASWFQYFYSSKIQGTIYYFSILSIPTIDGKNVFNVLIKYHRIVFATKWRWDSHHF